MAAYAALVSLMNDLELIPNHSIHSFSFDQKQISSLSRTVNFLVDFLETYDSHGCGREDVEGLESKITSAAHASHDVIESHVVDQIHAGSTLPRKAISDIFYAIKRKTMQFGSTTGGKPRSYFLPDLQKAIDEMDFVKTEATLFKERSGLKTEQTPYSSSTSSEPLISEKNFMVGFDAVVVRLLERLTGEPSGKEVIPIAGMGGIGKTTLARNVHNHLLIEQHFDLRLWATISQEYSADNFLTELLYGERKSPTGGNVNGLGEQLHKKLWGRRFLIVLDDMWSVEAWEEIQNFLPDNGNGSCVVVTTRLSNLAAHLSSFPFEMSFLDDDNSWELFCGKAFGEKEDCPIELEEIGKKIVRRCRGLPLSIVVIGGHLRRSSRTIRYWEKVASFINPISSLGEDEQCMEILSLSYQHLPPCLKPCFLYLGIFQEDQWIDASRLVEFLVCEGFIKPKEGSSFEEVAGDYLEDLIDRNLIFVRQRRWNGKVQYFGVHDIVRELCLKICKKEKFMCVLEDAIEGIGSERRIVIRRAKLNSFMIGDLKSASLLRTLVCQGVWLSHELSIDFRLVRLSVGAEFSPDTHFKQVNLRYLSFEKPSSMSRFSKRPYLPSSVSLFWNVQTLIIKSTDDAQISAPYEIWEMPQLRHLQFYRVCLLDPRPNQEKCIALRNLHTLDGVENLSLTEEVCKRMPNIKKLTLHYRLSGDDITTSYYCLQNIGHFNKLESLMCVFSDDFKQRDTITRITFPSSLLELSLWNSRLRWVDLTVMINSLPHLGSLDLFSVQGAEWDLVEEEFSHLKVLRISRCDDLIHWNANSSHFPILESLYIWLAPKLSEIPFDIGEIPTLRRIQLRDCSVSSAVSAMRIVVEQESLENLDLQLYVYFDKMEEVELFQKMVQEEGLISNSLRLYHRHSKV